MKKTIHFDVAMMIKYGFFLLLLAVAIFLFRKMACGGEEEVAAADVINALQDAGYVEPGGDPELPDSLEEIEGIVPVLSGSGIAVVEEGQAWPDTLPVEVGVAIDPAGNPWVGVWVNDKPIEWIEVPSIDWPEEDLKDSDWVVVSEVTLVEEGVDWGLGLGWTPLHHRGVNSGLALTVDGSLVDGDAEWAAIGAYADTRISIFRVGGNLGYQFGRGEGFRAGINMGVGLDF